MWNLQCYLESVWVRTHWCVSCVGGFGFLIYLYNGAKQWFHDCVWNLFMTDMYNMWRHMSLMNVGNISINWLGWNIGGYLLIADMSVFAWRLMTGQCSTECQRWVKGNLSIPPSAYPGYSSSLRVRAPTSAFKKTITNNLSPKLYQSQNSIIS